MYGVSGVAVGGEGDHSNANHWVTATSTTGIRLGNNHEHCGRRGFRLIPFATAKLTPTLIPSRLSPENGIAVRKGLREGFG